ncbi:hypothetical protein pb186bvf_020868 [Paramecium bursaria]
MPTKKGFNSIGQLVQFCLSSNEDPTQDQVKEALFYVRQVIALIIGIVAGFYNLTGIATIIGFVMIQMGFAYYYTYRFLQADEEKIEVTEIYLEGFPVSFGEFMLSWILVYTATQ